MDKKPDFFISRAGADKAAAAAIAEIIRAAGLTPFHQDADFGHADFMRMMETGYESARTIALLSPDYQKSEYCRTEYNQVLGKDPANKSGKLVILRVGPCEPEGNLQNLRYTDLVPVITDTAALTRVVRVALGIEKAAAEIAFAQTYARAGQQILHPDVKAVKGFAGREDLLDAITAKLAAKSSVAIRNSTQTTLAMRGMGGVGKTSLAREYAWRNRERYCGVWWIRAETPTTLVDDLGALGRRFIPGLDAVEPEDAARTTLDRLAQIHTEKPWLLVYDNADDAAVLRKFTPANNADVLITTRRTDWLDDADEQLAVDVFDRETAIAFLLKHARHGDTGSAGRLADALDRLPLALAHARSYCWGRNWPFDSYIAKLPELIAKAPKDAAYPASVFATFSLAIERAAAECASAERIMGLLAFFAPDQAPLWLIPEDVLTETERGDALAALNAVSLVRFDNLADGTPAVSVHRLVQEVMRVRLRVAGRFETAAEEAVRLLYNAYDFHSGTVETMHRRSAWLSHALAILEHAPRNGDAGSQTVWLCNFIGDFRVSRGELTRAREAYESGAKIASGSAKADPDDVERQRDLSVSYDKVGDVLMAQGDLPGALKAYRDSLAIRERLAAADPGNAGWQRDLSVSYNKVGDVLVAQGDLPGALKAYRDSLAIRERLAAADPGNAGWQRDLSVSYDKVGDVLVAQGDLPGALEAYRDGRAIFERLAAADPGNAGWQRDLSVSYEKVGDVLVAQGDLPGALKAYRDSLAIRERLAAADPGNAGWQRDLSVSYGKVAGIDEKMGNASEALEGYRKGRAIIARLMAVSPGNATLPKDLAFYDAKIAGAGRGAAMPPAAAARDERKRGLFGRLLRR